MKYSLYEEYSYFFEDGIFKKEELDIIQDMFNILPVGEFNSDRISHSDGIYMFNIYSDSINYISDNKSFSFTYNNNSFSCFLNLLNKCNIYCVNIVNGYVNIIHYDDIAFKYYSDFNNVVNICDKFYDNFRKIGIIPDNDFRCIINNSILEYFKMINLLISNVDNFSRLFEGELLEELLIDKSNDKCKTKKI